MRLTSVQPRQRLARLAAKLGFSCKGIHSYSQEGEDMVLARFFQDSPSGFFVDVGAHHPTRYSNTYHFYEKGWRGINIDAMPGSMEPFKRLRPKDINIEAAVSDTDKSLTFYMFNEPALNTCDPEVARSRDGTEHFRITRTEVLTSVPLSRLLSQHLLERQQIDFMTVDVEGHDMEVLASNDWGRFRPKVILAEDFGTLTLESSINSNMARYLRGKDYVPFAKTVNTLFFRAL